MPRDIREDFERFAARLHRERGVDLYRVLGRVTGHNVGTTRLQLAARVENTQPGPRLSEVGPDGRLSPLITTGGGSSL